MVELFDKIVAFLTTKNRNQKNDIISTPDAPDLTTLSLTSAPWDNLPTENNVSKKVVPRVEPITPRRWPRLRRLWYWLLRKKEEARTGLTIRQRIKRFNSIYEKGGNL